MSGHVKAARLCPGIVTRISLHEHVKWAKLEQKAIGRCTEAFFLEEHQLGCPVNGSLILLKLASSSKYALSKQFQIPLCSQT